MRLTAIRAKNYRSFPQAELTLRPLTLLYGENNSGKSALLRLLPLLLDSLKPGIPHGLDLTSEPLAKATLADLVTRQPTRGGRDIDPTPTQLGLGFSVEDEAGVLHADYVFNAPDSIKTLTIVSDDQEVHFSSEGATGLYGFGGQQSVPLSFEGLCPTNQDAHPLVQRLYAACRALRDDDIPHLWLNARRPPTQREYELRDRPHSFIDQTPHLLQADPALLATVSNWYQTQLKRVLLCETTRRDGKDFFKMLLALPDDTTRQINLADSGEGLSQVLPVLTAAAQLDAASSPLRYLCIEEPESNLHANRHEALLLRFTTHAAAHRDHTILIETHSRPALFATLIQIAENKLKPDDVALHWISALGAGMSEVIPTTLSPDGFIEHGWPISKLLVMEGGITC